MPFSDSGSYDTVSLFSIFTFSGSCDIVLFLPFLSFLAAATPPKEADFFMIHSCDSAKLLDFSMAHGYDSSNNGKTLCNLG